MRKRKREKEIATARAIIEEYRQRSGKFDLYPDSRVKRLLPVLFPVPKSLFLLFTQSFSANIGYEALDQDHESTLDKKPKCVITDIN